MAKISNLTGKGADIDGSLNEKKLIVNELLASAWHAIQGGKLTPDIAQTFAFYYDDKEVKLAYEEMNTWISACDLNRDLLPRRSASKDKSEARQKDIVKIIDVIRDIDWQNKDIPFLVAGIGRICTVYGSLRDEIQSRGEMQRLAAKVNALEVVCQTLTGLSGKIEKLTETLDSSKASTSVPAYRDILTSTVIQPEMPLIPIAANAKPKQSFTGKRLNIKNIIPSPIKDTAFIAEPPSPSWRVQMPRKKQPPKRKIQIFGNDECELLKSSQMKPIKIFVTRCHVDATADLIKNHLETKWTWEVLNVEQMNTRYDSYRSFKITLNGSGKEPGEFLDPSKWPKNWFVRKFFEVRKEQRSSEIGLQKSMLQ